MIAFIPRGHEIMKRMLITMLVFICTRTISYGQSVTLDRLGKDKWLKYSGGISAMGVYYEGMAPRDPFGYMLRGNIDLTLAGMYRLPFAFTYTNQQFSFPSPLKLNRFSFHPSYKGLRLHFGDASMSFSPYTLNGHQFTGFGGEYTWAQNWSVAIMYGRLLKRVPFLASQSGSTPVHERRGYGLKLGYKGAKWNLNGMLFSARDLVEANTSAMERFPFPYRNLVVGVQGRWTILKRGSLMFDYAHSVIGIAGKELDLYPIEVVTDSVSRLGNDNFGALKIGLSYPAYKGKLSVEYERIDPGYRTFGAYYFNADLENISIAGGQSLFKGKVNITIRSGVQRDNLERTGNSEFKRLVNSLDLSYSPAEHFSVSTRYSNFQTHTNSRNQFDQINRVSSMEMSDTLNYRQLSQQASLHIQYRRSSLSGRMRAWSFLVNFQENRNESSGTQKEETGSDFYQGAVQYDIPADPGKWGYTFSANASFNSGAGMRNMIWGPAFSTGKAMLGQKLKTRLSLAYNLRADAEGQIGQVFNSRLNASWSVFGNHRVGLSGLWQHREEANVKRQDLTLQFTYHYRFDNFRLELQKKSPSPVLPAPAEVRFRYRNVLYSGTFSEVNRQIALVSREPQFLVLPTPVRQQLDRLRQAYIKQDKRTEYKFHALHYLAVLYHYGDAIQTYYHQADMAIRKILYDMKKTDHELERRYVHSRQERERTQKSLVGESAVSAVAPLEEIYLECRARLKGHRWLEEQLRDYDGLTFDGSVHPVIRTYLETHLQENLTSLGNGVSPETLRSEMEIGLIDHFYRRSLLYTPNTRVVLRYYNLKTK